MLRGVFPVAWCVVQGGLDFAECDALTSSCSERASLPSRAAVRLLVSG